MTLSRREGGVSLAWMERVKVIIETEGRFQSDPFDQGSTCCSTKVDEGGRSIDVDHSRRNRNGRNEDKEPANRCKFHRSADNETVFLIRGERVFSFVEIYWQA